MGTSLGGLQFCPCQGPFRGRRDSLCTSTRDPQEAHATPSQGPLGSTLHCPHTARSSRTNESRPELGRRSARSGHQFFGHCRTAFWERHRSLRDIPLCTGKPLPLRASRRPSRAGAGPPGRAGAHLSRGTSAPCPHGTGTGHWVSVYCHRPSVRRQGLLSVWQTWTSASADRKGHPLLPASGSGV